jgi:hypothetical protein
MNTETETKPYFHNTEDQLRILAVYKASLQSLLSLYNLFGWQDGAFRVSKELCAVLAEEFRLNPHSRRTR